MGTMCIRGKTLCPTLKGWKWGYRYLVFHRKRLEPRVLPWQQLRRSQSLSFVMPISGAGILWKHRQAKFRRQFHNFHQNLQVSYTKFNICFRHLVLLEMDCFEKIFKRALQKFAIQCK